MNIFLSPKREQSKNFFANPALALLRAIGYFSAMLSVIIETHNDEDGLARTLASLVPAAVEGMVREVIVCDHGSTDQSHFVADHAGCRFVARGGVAAGIRMAKSEWLVHLEPGSRLCNGWAEAVSEHTTGSSSAARFTSSKNGSAGLFKRLFSAKRPLSNGLLITKRQAAALSQRAPSGEALARGLSAKRLKAEIQVARRQK